MGQPGVSSPALVIQHTGQVFPLTQASIVIGRQADCAIVLSDPQVSRQHATVSWEAGIYTVQDLDSANGTYLNERRITGLQPLRHGDVLRLGNTQMMAFLAPASAMTQQSVATSPLASDDPQSRVLPIVLALLVAGVVVACSLLAFVFLPPLLGSNRPEVTIQAPSPNAQIVAGNEIILQAMATGARDIARLELYVDGTVVAQTKSPDPDGMASLIARQTWAFVQDGPHIISAVAYTTREGASAPASVEVSVVRAGGSPTPTMAATAAATTVAAAPSLTTPPPPTPFAAPSTPTPTVPPPTVPPPTLTPTETPSPTATPTRTPSPTPSSTPRPTATPSPTATEFPEPAIEYFRAVPGKIPGGGCTVLEWGAVTNATAAIIEPGIGGVATPGSQTVCPTETTTYILTAIGQSERTTALTTVTVGPPMPDLIVSSVAFEPSSPLQGQDTSVQIVIENVGTEAASIFNWEWEAAGDASFGGRLSALAPGEQTTVTALWNPSIADPNLPTIARADVDNEVLESNEDNNELIMNVEVIEPTFGDLVLQEFFLGVDGQIILRVANPGGRIIAPRFDYDLYVDDSLAKSGFGNTPPVGSMPTWTEYYLTDRHKVRIVIDPKGLIDEAEEGNNELTRVCSIETLDCVLP